MSWMDRKEISEKWLCQKKVLWFWVGTQKQFSCKGSYLFLIDVEQLYIYTEKYNPIYKPLI